MCLGNRKRWSKVMVLGNKYYLNYVYFYHYSGKNTNASKWVEFRASKVWQKKIKLTKCLTSSGKAKIIQWRSSFCWCTKPCWVDVFKTAQFWSLHLRKGTVESEKAQRITMKMIYEMQQLPLQWDIKTIRIHSREEKAEEFIQALKPHECAK